MDVRVASPTFSEKKTALTSRERKHKHRANLTDEQKAAIREKDAARKRLKRASERLTPKQIKDSRAADAARQAWHRAKKCTENAVPIKLGFKTKQTRGKAVKRALTSLPTTPSKRAEVVQLLIHSLILTSIEKILTPESIKCNSKSSDDTVRMVEDFFEDDANLQVMPGEKDILSVKAGTGLKEKKRKRLLLDGIDNLHYKYNSTPPKNKVGRSKFFALRPFWAIPVWKQLQDVYNCVYHENNDLICESLGKFARKMKLFLDFTSANSADAIWIPSV